MKEKLERLFPGGEWSLGQKSWMVKSGTYFCSVADVVDGEIVLTDLGRELTGATTPEAPKKLDPKKIGLKV